MLPKKARRSLLNVQTRIRIGLRSITWKVIVYIIVILFIMVATISISGTNQPINRSTNEPIHKASKHCNPETEMKRFIEAGGTKYVNETHRGTTCPKNDEWLKQFAAVDPPPQKNIVVIGCNKGMDAVDLFSQYDNEHTPFNSSLWRQARMDSYPSISHGACGQGSIQNSPQLDRKAHDSKFAMEAPTVLCVEPMPANIKLLKQMQAMTKINADKFQIKQYAVGNATGSVDEFVYFPDGEGGDEGGMISNNVNDVKVKFISLDALCKDMDVIDILSIDTEGNDPDVLFAGKQTLMRTRYLEFEVHRDIKGTAWEANTLYSVIEYLHDLDFDCYWINGGGKMFQITNCWNAEHEKQAFAWANVMCIKRTDVSWNPIIKSIHAKQQVNY